MKPARGQVIKAGELSVPTGPATEHVLLPGNHIQGRPELGGNFEILHLPIDHTGITDMMALRKLVRKCFGVERFSGLGNAVIHAAELGKGAVAVLL